MMRVVLQLVAVVLLVIAAAAIALAVNAPRLLDGVPVDGVPVAATRPA